MHPNATGAQIIADQIYNALTGVLPSESAKASSEQSSGNSAAKAFDGNSDTRWSSTFTSPEWIWVNLGHVGEVSAVTLTWEAWATSYSIDVSLDCLTWKSVYSTTIGSLQQGQVTFPPANARYVRISCIKRGEPQYGYSLYEIRVTEHPVKVINKSEQSSVAALRNPTVARNGCFVAVPGGILCEARLIDLHGRMVASRACRGPGSMQLAAGADSYYVVETNMGGRVSRVKVLLAE